MFEQKLNRPLILATMILASMAAVMSTDMYAPSLATLPGILGTHASMVQLTMAANALFFGLAQLVHGPMSDRFGRRPLMLWGVGLFALFSLMCGLAQNVEQLIIARALQGAAASVEAVLLLAVIGDIFEPKDRPKAFAIYGAVWAIAPALAPVLGGHIHEIAGWQWNFYVVSITCVIAFSMIYLFLPETGTTDPEALKPSRVIGNYKQLLSHRGFLGLSLLMALPLAAILVYITAAPFIYQEYFGFSVSKVGYYQAVMVVAYMFASALSGQLASKVSHQKLLLVGIVLTCLGMLVSACLLSFEHVSANAILLGMVLFCCGFGPLFSIAPGMIMDMAPTGRGTAAAMLGALEMVIAGIAVSLFSSFDNTPMSAMALTFLVISVLVIAISITKPWASEVSAQIAES